MTITVNEVNDAPILDVIGAQSVDEESLLSFTVTADDPNDDPANNVTLSTTGLPTGAVFTPATGLFSWTPTDAQQGSYSVTFFATDDGSPNLSDSEIVTINVDDIVTNTPPTTVGISDVQVAEDAADSVIDLFAAFDDAEDPDANLTLTVLANTNSGLFTSTAIDGIAGTLTLNYEPDTTGSATITIIATDTGGLTVDTTFVVTVITATEQINDVVDAVETLADTSVLTGGQSNPLLNFLDQALKDLAKGKTSQGIKKLNDFIDRIQDLIDSGDLSPTEGQPLLDAANAAIAAALPGAPSLATERSEDLLMPQTELTRAAIPSLLSQATFYWQSQGLVGEAQLQLIGRIQVHIADLPPTYLGAASSSEIWLDRDGAGYGWSIGSSVDGERRMDLLSAFTHESGHAIGIDHNDDHGVMNPYLRPGASLVQLKLSRALPEVTTTPLIGLVRAIDAANDGSSLAKTEPRRGNYDQWHLKAATRQDTVLSPESSSQIYGLADFANEIDELMQDSEKQERLESVLDDIVPDLKV